MVLRTASTQAVAKAAQDDTPFFIPYEELQRRGNLVLILLRGQGKRSASPYAILE